MKNSLSVLTISATFLLASSRVRAAEPKLGDQSAPESTRAVRGERIGSPIPAQPSSSAANPSLESALARARIVAGQLHTNGFRTNATGHLIVGFETLSDFKFDTYTEVEPPFRYPVVKTRDPVPNAIQRLDGRRIAVDGYMMPLRTGENGCSDLLLVRDLASCCYGRVPKLNHWIHVKAPAAGFRTATGIPVTILGTLRVGPFIEDGSLNSLYEMDGEQLEIPDYPNYR